MSTMTLDTMFRPGTSPVRVAAPRSTVRLTRRGRLVIIAAALLVAFAIGVFVTAAGSVATQEPEATEIVQVGTGDTLWEIAADLADDGEVRAMMERIEKLNALDTTVLQAGQRLVVPAS
jgi:predicted Zn-dependent protease